MCEYRCDLVIAKEPALWNDSTPDNSALTMTDLKKEISARGYFNRLRIHADYWSESKRLGALHGQLRGLLRKAEALAIQGDEQVAIPFETACRIGGQTFEDQTGFGWEYNGPYLVYEGKQYGETTSFYIIGGRIRVGATIWY